MTRAQMETRRVQAIPQIEAWVRPSQMSRELKVSRTTLYRWKKARANGGDLKEHKASGRPQTWKPEDISRAQAIFRCGPRIILGVLGDRWTAALFCRALNQGLGLTFHPDHVCRLMHKWGLR